MTWGSTHYSTRCSQVNISQHRVSTTWNVRATCNEAINWQRRCVAPRTIGKQEAKYSKASDWQVASRNKFWKDVKTNENCREMLVIRHCRVMWPATGLRTSLFWNISQQTARSFTTLLQHWLTFFVLEKAAHIFLFYLQFNSMKNRYKSEMTESD